MTKIIRNSCPPVAGACTHNPDGCQNVELTWGYEYESDSDGMPVKLKKILAPAGFQSWQYVYYGDNEPPNPECALKAIYRV